MQFLVKDSESSILRKELTYKKNRAENNQALLKELLIEQKGFCAYTECYLRKVHSPEVEHFNPALKYNDDYFNYYVALRSANLRKRRKENRPEFQDALFFESRFFQDKECLFSRIRYVPDEFSYEAIDPSDEEAWMLIDYLGLNDWELVRDRRAHAKRVKGICIDSHWSEDTIRKYFERNPEELSFLTALEHDLALEFSSLIPELPLFLAEQ